jgi:hypothetical protein
MKPKLSIYYFRNRVLGPARAALYPYLLERDQWVRCQLFGFGRAKAFFLDDTGIEKINPSKIKPYPYTFR